MHQSSEIEPQHCVPDELHMLLRISDVFFRSFFGYMIYLDKRNKTHRNTNNGLLQKSVKLVKGFGITFSVWMCNSIWKPSEVVFTRHFQKQATSLPFFLLYKISVKLYK